MTLTQLGAFVLVARLGSVRAAAKALGVSEPAVSQALTALRRHVGDELVVRSGSGMALTAGGRRLIGIASQMVALGAEAEQAVREANGAPERLRVVAESVIAEMVAPGLLEAFNARTGGVEATAGVASRAEMVALLLERMADVAVGPALHGEDAPGVESAPIMRCQLVAVGRRGHPRVDGPARLRSLTWLVDPSGVDPGGWSAGVLARLRVPEDRIRVFPSQAAAWSAAADGEGVAPALHHLALPEVNRGALSIVDVPTLPQEVRWYVNTLAIDRRSAAATSLRRFLTTPEAMRLMHTPGRGVAPSRFRPPVYVTIWN